MIISVVIPAHNRPDYLEEAVASIAAQSDDGWEVVVVDDGSQPPIDAFPLRTLLGERLVYVRHESAQGIARAKNAGVRAARGEIITILDDDDLLAPQALQAVRAAYVAHPELDCVFLGVDPFGTYAAGVIEGRRKAMARFIELGTTAGEGLLRFDDRLFAALVESVPIDFQRPAARRGAWNIVGGFDEAGLFSESAWSIRAAVLCKVALTTQALSCWRIHDSNFGWLDGASAQAAQLRQVNNSLASADALLARFRDEHAAATHRLRLLRASLSERHFGKAYLLRHDAAVEGWQALWRSMVLGPQLRHAKLALRYVLSTMRPHRRRGDGEVIDR